jgi:hypothetical protein
MAKVIAFNNATIGGATTGLTTAGFVSGSGVYTPKLNTKDATTADGTRHFVPYEKGGTASFSVYGNRLSYNTAIGLGVAIVLKRDSATVYSGTGLVTTSYNDIEDITKIDIKFDPA